MAGSVLNFWCQEHILSLKKGSNELPRTYPAERKMKDEMLSVTQQMSTINAVFLHLLSQWSTSL